MDTNMIRIWSEHLPLQDAAQPDVVGLLRRHGVHPIFAAPHDVDDAALGRVVRAYRDAGLEPGVWPLLSDAQGYWPSEDNAQVYFQRVEQLLSALEQQGATPAWLAVDLEPPLTQIDVLRHAPTPLHTKMARMLRQNLDAARFARSVQAFEAGVGQVRARGVRTLSVTLPLAAHDLRDGVPLWQDVFQTPWAGVSWDAAGIMAYGSMVSGYSRGLLSHDDARAMHYRLMRHVARAFGARAHASIGVTGVGKLGDEPVYTDPAQLGLDASAARAAGIEDLGIFCLEGVLAQPAPEAWLEAVAHAVARAPAQSFKTRCARLMGWGLRKAALGFVSSSYDRR